ncbi:MAG: hypothetical protein IJX28_03060 [Clostridia bacterium]|nr:hypothetical protein [Clostridia bacterium]
MLKRIFTATFAVLLLFLYSCSHPSGWPNPTDTAIRTQASTEKTIELTHPVHFYDQTSAGSYDRRSVNKFLRTKNVRGYMEYQEFSVLCSENMELSHIDFRYVAEEDFYYPREYWFSDPSGSEPGFFIFISKEMGEFGYTLSQRSVLSLEEAKELETFGSDMRKSFIDVPEDYAGRAGVYVEIGKAYYLFLYRWSGPYAIFIPVDDVILYIRFSRGENHVTDIPGGQVMNNLMNTQTAAAQIDQLLAQWEGKWKNYDGNS